jgi:ABC-type multidrug transport system ATPase subunit
MINVVGVTQHYGVRPVLRDIDMTINSGELVAVMGPNGMGKSTLLRVVAGTLAPQAGFVEIDGLRRRASADIEIEIRRKVAYLPDHPWLPRQSTGRDFLGAVGRLYNIEQLHLIDHIERLLALFDLDHKADSPIRDYSNGQQKKIAICSALLTDASVLILDEPFTGGLDPAGILALRRVLKRLAERKDVTVLMATQLPDVAESLADRVAVIRQGELAAFDSIEGLRKTTGCSGSLQDILEKLIHPETLKNIDRYFGNGV